MGMVMSAGAGIARVHLSFPLIQHHRKPVLLPLVDDRQKRKSYG